MGWICLRTQFVVPKQSRPQNPLLFFGKCFSDNHLPRSGQHSPSSAVRFFRFLDELVGGMTSLTQICLAIQTRANLWEREPLYIATMRETSLVQIIPQTASSLQVLCGTFLSQSCRTSSHWGTQGTQGADSLVFVFGTTTALCTPNTRWGMSDK